MNLETNTTYGTVSLELGTVVHTLVPTLGAIKALQKAFQQEGGVRGALQSVGELNPTGMAKLIYHVSDAVHSVNRATPHERQAALNQLETEIYEAGLLSIEQKVREFANALLNPAAFKTKAPDAGKPETPSGAENPS